MNQTKLFQKFKILEFQAFKSYFKDSLFYHTIALYSLINVWH